MYRFVFLLIISVTRFFASEPPQWGENVTGVVTSFHTDSPEVALTFDACGGSLRSSQFDEKLISFLIRNQIPATLFINARWIDSNPDIFHKLASNPLFEIGNHGTLHRPLSVNGRSVYDINGTTSPEEVVKEIDGNEQKIAKLTGKHPLFFRTGTAYYDDESVRIARSYGVEIAGFSVLGDAGATLDSIEVARRIGNARKGDIIIAHMNHPESGTREGVIEGILRLKLEGFRFVRLSDVKDRLNRIP